MGQDIALGHGQRGRRIIRGAERRQPHPSAEASQIRGLVVSGY
jgi:hypothetical protein